MATQIANSLGTGGSPSDSQSFQKRTTRIVHADIEANGTDVDIEAKVGGASNWSVEATLSGDSGEAAQTTLSPNPDRIRVNVTSGTASVWVQD